MVQMSEKELAQYIGQKIKEFRKDARLTQRELGLKIKKSNNTISDYEKGVTAPKQDTLFALAAALNKKLDDFFPPRQSMTDLENIKDFLNNFDAADAYDMYFLKKLMSLVESLNETDRAEVIKKIKEAVSDTK